MNKTLSAKMISLLLPFLFFAPVSWGQENRLLIDKLKQKKYEEVEEVTDAELRAKAGSQSKWSLSGAFSYSGPRVNRLDEEVQPNPENTAMEMRTSLGGSLAARYRLSPSTSISADTGLRLFTPLSGAKDGELSDPGLSLEKLYPLWGLQMRSRYTASVTTADYYLDRGQKGRLNMAHDFKRKIGGEESAWLFSVGSSFNLFLYDRDYISGRGGDGKVSNYHLSIYPGFQYNIMDKLNVGTSLAFAYSNLRQEPNWWDWDRKLWSQRLSVGYAITRNVYVNPYLNFFPEKFSWNTTGVNMNLYVNLF